MSNNILPQWDDLDKANKNHYQMKGITRQRPPVLNLAEAAFLRVYDLHTDAVDLWRSGKMDTPTFREIVQAYWVISDYYSRVYQSWLNGSLVIDRLTLLQEELEAHRDRNELMGVGVQ